MHFWNQTNSALVKESFRVTGLMKLRLLLASMQIFWERGFSPVEYARQNAKNRKINDLKGARMSRHYQVEAHMSLTGSNADNRILVKPSEQGAAIWLFIQRRSWKKRRTRCQCTRFERKMPWRCLDKAADDLMANAGHSLVVMRNQ